MCSLIRCEEYRYRLEQEVISGYDEDMNLFDLVLYFPSSTVEVWTEFELIDFTTFVSNVGGHAGLFLGASVLSISLSLMENVRNFMSKLVVGKMRKEIK